MQSREMGQLWQHNELPSGPKAFPWIPLLRGTAHGRPHQPPFTYLYAGELIKDAQGEVGRTGRAAMGVLRLAGKGGFPRPLYRCSGSGQLYI